MNPAVAPFTLHFHEWSCGHHCITPQPVPVHSVEQALLILSAISNSISQPGSARAQLLSEQGYVDFYLCEDHVAPREVSSEVMWTARPVLIYGPLSERDAIRTPVNKEALIDLYWRQSDLAAEEWDGNRYLDGNGFACTPLTLDELNAMQDAPDARSWGEPARRLWDALPVFVASSVVLQELRDWHDVAAGEASL